MGVLSTTDDNEVDIRSSHSENFRSSVGYRSAYFWSKPELCAITMTASSTNAVTAASSIPFSFTVTRRSIGLSLACDCRAAQRAAKQRLQ